MRKRQIPRGETQIARLSSNFRGKKRKFWGLLMIFLITQCC